MHDQNFIAFVNVETIDRLSVSDVGRALETMRTGNNVKYTDTVELLDNSDVVDLYRFLSDNLSQEKLGALGECFGHNKLNKYMPPVEPIRWASGQEWAGESWDGENNV